MNIPALDDLKGYLAVMHNAPTYDALLASLKSAAAAPEREDNDLVLSKIAPDAPGELLGLMKAARDSLRKVIQSSVLDREKSQERLTALRGALKKQNADGFIIPLNDEFHGEAAPAASERLKWLTGFTGSAGMAAVLQDTAAIFVDGRYTLQVRQEVKADLFTPRHVSDEPLSDWLKENMTAGQVLLIDPWLHTESNVNTLRKLCEAMNVTLAFADPNPVDTVWADHPPEPLALVVPHPLQYAGQSSTEKRQAICEALKPSGVDAVIHTLPDVTAWLLNLRGADLPSTPFALGFTILNQDSTVDLYMDEEKLSPDLRPHLGNAVRIHNRAAFGSGLDALAGKTVQVDPSVTSQWIINRLDAAAARVVRADDPCMLPKATKNAVELDGTRRAHLRDGAAIVKFLHWLATETPSGTIDELQAERQLRAFRQTGDKFRDVSFSTISGAGPNGAVVHYRATEATNRKLEPGSLYLVDSGGQYLDGTTDITRTIAIGTPSDEMRERFTLVLKGHIALARAIFPEGTSGSQLDALARLPLWQRGLDYDHGTGHGVGSYLSVHEGPQRISKAPNTVALRPGMILSNEPGYYKTNAYGIRIENLVAVTELAPAPGGERSRLGFETLTFAPIDRALIDPSLMDELEIQWMNDYHAAVWDKISPQVEGTVKDWLKQATAPL
ncbi:aminopeptidase P family protein [Sneathiella chinensis]|uniref:Xaa-Pro aminopeptidase n=1 Tax=Sneathiella chinensis TaxID=349750 RepID=A0ABQ5U2U9_9PROT|nr:aminopeptidase P family protein [Sneathiella chinensis]GLQ06016.1 Xaa-Pro aminopeptidase [Sneathiella chinensis]